MKLAIFIPMLFFTVLSCQEATEENKKTTDLATLDQLLSDYQEGRYALYPWEATFAGDSRYNDLLPNFYSQAFLDKEETFFSDIKAKLGNIDDNDLDENQLLSKKVLLWEANTQLSGRDFPGELLPIDQFSSPLLMFAQLGSGASAQPFNTPKDYRDWLSRMDSFIPIVDTAIANMHKGIAQGYVLPKTLTQKVIPQINSLISDSAEQNLFYGPIGNMPEDFTPEEKDEFTAAYTKMIEEGIVPKMQELATFLTEVYLPASRETSGIDQVPGGSEHYEHLIKLFTTTEMTANEIHELGLSEVARIRSEMEQVKKQVGFEGSLQEFFDHVRTRKELMPFTDPQQVIDNFNAIHDKMKPQIAMLFDKVPDTPFEVRRTESFREASASAEYNPGSLDGTRPGIFYVPIPDVNSYNTLSDEDLFLHEAIPGHHFQISLTQENEQLPSFRKTLFYSAYGEGWALYTESLGKELGLYDDPYQYFGMLSAEMHRAIRLVVDTGIHTQGWSREKAIQFSLDNEAEPEASIISEIERYMAIPGQALSYKIGQLKIKELRARAEMELGEAFDIKEFHNRILESGSLPLALLEEKVDSWINSLKR
ncbi:MAG: DUF885 domain-containing protein [Gilvibacter sp.]